MEVIRRTFENTDYIEIYQTFINGTERWNRLKRGTDAWSDWVREDNFGCGTISELANLLGVKFGISEYYSDCNVVTNNLDKLQSGGFEYSTLNRPPVSGGSDTGSGVCVYIPCNVGAIKMGIQIGAKFSGNEVYLRVYWVSGFSNWFQLTVTA